MDIVFATSNQFSRPALITIKTLLMNNTKVDTLNLYYVEHGVSEENQTLITDLVESYGRSIVFISMPEEYLLIKGIVKTHPITYSYCFFQDILPEAVEKVLLLEGDCIITGDLSEMYSLDVEGYYLAAADDLQSKWFKRKLGIGDTSVYFNCGIMLINLKKWRENGITEKIKNIIEKGDCKFFYEVQDELNILMEGQIKILPPKYNCTTAIFLFDYEDMLRYRKPSTVCSKSEFEEAKRKPVVVHFTRSQIIQPRPWIEGCMHPYKEYYEKAKADTALANEKLWPANRSVKNRISQFLFTRVSKSFTAWLLGSVHSKLYPMFLYRFMLRKAE